MKLPKLSNQEYYQFRMLTEFVVAVSGRPNAITFITSIPSRAKPLIKSKFVIL